MRLQIKINNGFKITKIGGTINHPWGMSLIDNKSVIVTSKKGLIYLINLDFPFDFVYFVIINSLILHIFRCIQSIPDYNDVHL